MCDEAKRSSDRQAGSSALWACANGDWSAARQYRYVGPMGRADEGQVARKARCSNCGMLLAQISADGTEYGYVTEPPVPRVWTVVFADMWGSRPAAPEGTLCSLECASQWVEKVDEWVHWPTRHHRWIVKLDG